MTLQRTFPFRRISVDRMVHGVTRVWWQLEPLFQEIGPYIFQLQVGSTGLSEALDWQNVGIPVVNGFFADDTILRAAGSINITNYRVTLTTPTSTYVSAAAPCLGRLGEKDWLLAREIIRKERLRHHKVSIDGYLIKELRYGKPCERCRDIMTEEATDTSCPICLGTGFENGYHPAVPMQCWDLSLLTIQEMQDLNIKGSTVENAYIGARVIGFPGLNRGDVWVNAHTDDRWLIKTIRTSAAMRGVPLVYDIQMGLLPYSSGYYQLSLEAPDPSTFMSKLGSGCVTVTADYLPDDGLKYADANDEFISGAIVYAFNKADYDASYPVHPYKQNALATTRTTADGSWETNLQLDPGDYVLIYEKADKFGPDTVVLVVEDPCALDDESSESSASSSSVVACPSPPALKKFDSFWDI